MFEPLVFNKNVKVCAVTGIERTDCIKLEPKDKDEDATWVLPLVKRQAELGYVLKDVDYVVTNLAKFENTYLDNRSKCNTISIGIKNYLFMTLRKMILRKFIELLPLILRA